MEKISGIPDKFKKRNNELSYVEEGGFTRATGPRSSLKKAKKAAEKKAKKTDQTRTKYGELQEDYTKTSEEGMKEKQRQDGRDAEQESDQSSKGNIRQGQRRLHEDYEKEHGQITSPQVTAAPPEPVTYQSSLNTNAKVSLVLITRVFFTLSTATVSVIGEDHDGSAYKSIKDENVCS